MPVRIKQRRDGRIDEDPDDPVVVRWHERLRRIADAAERGYLAADDQKLLGEPEPTDARFCPYAGHLCRLKHVRFVADDRQWDRSQVTPPIPLRWSEDVLPDWIPPLRRVPEPVEIKTCLRCRAIFAPSDPGAETPSEETAWLALFDALGLLGDRNWTPPDPRGPWAGGPMAELLPLLDRSRLICTDCPHRSRRRRSPDVCQWRIFYRKRRPGSAGTSHRKGPHETLTCRRERALAQRLRRAESAVAKGRAPGRAGRPLALDLTPLERKVCGAVQSHVRAGMTRAEAIKAVAAARGCAGATIRSVLRRVARKRERALRKRAVNPL